jgi:hypothetical protein
MGDVMIVYMALISYWGLVGIIFKMNNSLKLRYNHKVYFIIAGISLFFIMALRGVSVGTDTLSYYYEYENADIYLNNLLRESEFGYSYFNYVINRLGFNFQSYLAIIAAIVVIAISNLYYKYSKNILLSYYLHVTIGLFAMTMTGLRQTLAVALTIFAFIYLMKNKKLMFFILVGIAYSFHNSAITFLLVFFLRKARINKKIGFIIYGLFCMVFIAREWIDILIQYIIPDKYIKYMLMKDAIYVNPLVIIVAMAIPLACLFFWPKVNDKDNEDYIRTMSIFFLLSCLNFVVYFLALEIKLFERISFYFIVYNTILIPNIIQGIKSKDIRMLAKIACIILPLIQFVITTPGSSMGIDTYKFFWE